MRLLFSLILAVLGVSAAHATTIDNFTYTYVLGGNSYTNTFSLVDGQSGISAEFNRTYLVALNGAQTSQARVTFGADYITETSSGLMPSGLQFRLDPGPQIQLLDYGYAATSGAIKAYSPTGLTFNPGFYAFGDGGVIVGGAFLRFDSSSLTITQSTLPDPTPMAVTPEPGTLCLLGTSMLGMCAIGRGRLTGRSGASAAV